MVNNLDLDKDIVSFVRANIHVFFHLNNHL